MTFTGNKKPPHVFTRLGHWIAKAGPWPVVAIAAFALWARLAGLLLRPFHHDEGINGWFIERLVLNNDYQYSPEHYHGPSLFYLGKLFSGVWGLSEFTIRLIPVVFGVLLCLLPAALRRIQSPLACLAVAFTLAFMPSSLFFSRYAIHEIIFVFFTALFAISLFLYLKHGEWISLLTAAFALASACATKETIVVAVAAIGIGTLLAGFRSTDLAWESLRSRVSAKAAGIFFGGYFTSLLLWFRPKEIGAFFKSYLFYSKLGSTAHQKPWHYHLMLLAKAEPVLVAALFLGAGVAFKRRRAIDLYLFGWAAVSFLAYSVISYKTPWLIINVAVPMAFLLGSAVDDLVEAAKLNAKRLTAIGVCAALLLFSLWNAWRFSYRTFREGENPYCYSHTVASAIDLQNRLLVLLREHPDAKVDVVSPEYWPYPFTLRAVKEQTLYWGKMIDHPDNAFIIARIDQAAELKTKVTTPYKSLGVYDIRGGLKLELYARESLGL